MFSLFWQEVSNNSLNLITFKSNNILILKPEFCVRVLNCNTEFYLWYWPELGHNKTQVLNKCDLFEHFHINFTRYTSVLKNIGVNNWKVVIPTGHKGLNTLTQSKPRFRSVT